jgi:SIR2-like protein
VSELYYHSSYKSIRPGGRAFLPVKTLRRRLDAVDRQRLIPFLGAGGSLPAVSAPALTPPGKRPTAETLNQLYAELEIHDAGAQRFVDVALQFAQLVEQRNALVDSEDEQRAPSSWQLARRLAETLSLEPLRPLGNRLRGLLNETPGRDDYLDVVKNVAGVMGLARSVPQLLTVASYFNKPRDREELVHNLVERFARVRHVTPIQEVVGCCAKQFVDAQNALPRTSEKDDYLIITTNYDQLIEQNLTDLQVPTCVLRVDRKSRVFIDFMPGAQDFLKLTRDQFAELERTYKEDDFQTHRQASQFCLSNKSHAVAMVYKIHGCPVSDERYRADNVVISDQDYVMFIQKNGLNNELIPAYIRKRAMYAGFLFLGYSFSDWNVRSLYKHFVRSREDSHRLAVPPQMEEQLPAAGGVDDEEDEDYIVMRSYDDEDDYFFQQWRVSVLVSELDEFAAALRMAALPRERAS